MPNQTDSEASLFLDILHTLERIGAPYMIIGGFAGTLYGVTRVTYDIDIVVSLDAQTIEALVAAYPPPRYYADPQQIVNSMQAGIMFNIIDTTRGEKADLIPLVRSSPYLLAFQRRVRRTMDVEGGQDRMIEDDVRQTIDVPGGLGGMMQGEPRTLEVWCARPEDVIVGKLMAWAEGRSRRHETDMYEMMVFRYLTAGSGTNEDFDEAYIDERAKALGEDVDRLWQAAKKAARQEAEK